MKTFRTLGTDYPIIKTLGRGWHLVAHQNGPAIAKVWDDDGDGGLLASPARSCEDLPEDVRTAAIEALIDATWPKLKPDYYNPEPAKTRAPGSPIMDEDDTHRDLRQLCQEQTKRIEEMQRQLEPCEADRASWAKINEMLCEAMPGYKGPPAPDDWCRCALMELLDQRRALRAALANSLPTLQTSAPPAYLDAKQALADVNKTLRES